MGQTLAKFVSFFQWWRQQTTELKTNTSILICAVRHPALLGMPVFFAVLVVAYVISPIDLIPDFVPVFVYLDNLLLLPVGLYIAGKLVPSYVWHECSMLSRNTPISRTLYSGGIGIVLCVWIGTAYILIRCLF